MCLNLQLWSFLFIDKKKNNLSIPLHCRTTYDGRWTYISADWSGMSDPFECDITILDWPNERLSSGKGTSNTYSCKTNVYHPLGLKVILPCSRYVFSHFSYYASLYSADYRLNVVNSFARWGTSLNMDMCYHCCFIAHLFPSPYSLYTVLVFLLDFIYICICCT